MSIVLFEVKSKVFPIVLFYPMGALCFFGFYFLVTAPSKDEAFDVALILFIILFFGSILGFGIYCIYHALAVMGAYIKVHNDGLIIRRFPGRPVAITKRELLGYRYDDIENKSRKGTRVLKVYYGDKHVSIYEQYHRGFKELENYLVKHSMYLTEKPKPRKKNADDIVEIDHDYSVGLIPYAGTVVGILSPILMFVDKFFLNYRVFSEWVMTIVPAFLIFRLLYSDVIGIAVGSEYVRYKDVAAKRDYGKVGGAVISAAFIGYLLAGLFSIRFFVFNVNNLASFNTFVVVVAVLAVGIAGVIRGRRNRQMGIKSNVPRKILAYVITLFITLFLVNAFAYGFAVVAHAPSSTKEEVYVVKKEKQVSGGKHRSVYYYFTIDNDGKYERYEVSPKTYGRTRKGDDVILATYDSFFGYGVKRIELE